MNALILRWKYQFYMVQSYLASMMGDTITSANMKSIADDFYRLWCREQVNIQSFRHPARGSRSTL